VAAEIGFVAGLAGWFGAFRRRPGTSLPTLVAGVAIAVALLGGFVWFGILPFYANLCGPVLDAPAPSVCFQLFAPGSIDPLFVAIGIGIAVMLVASLVALGVRLARDRDLGVVIVFVVGIGCGVISAFIAAPIVTMVYGGVTASGTDFLVAAFQQVGSSLDDAVLQQALLSDTFDKTLEYLIVFTLLGTASRRVLARFPQGERAIGTVEA
jgi:energy-coupling factor transport system substrate-specific component